MNRAKTFYLISFLCFVSVATVQMLDVGQVTVRENQHFIIDGDPAPTTNLVITSADWCGPCKKLAPIVATLKKEGYSIKTNIDNAPNHPVPRLQWFRFGTLERTEHGALPKEEIVKIFAEIESKVFSGRTR